MTDRKSGKAGVRSTPSTSAAPPSSTASTSSTSSSQYSALPPHIDEMRRKVFVDGHSASNVRLALSPAPRPATCTSDHLSLTSVCVVRRC